MYFKIICLEVFFIMHFLLLVIYQKSFLEKVFPFLILAINFFNKNGLSIQKAVGDNKPLYQPPALSSLDKLPFFFHILFFAIKLYNYSWSLLYTPPQF